MQLFALFRYKVFSKTIRYLILPLYLESWLAYCHLNEPKYNTLAGTDIVRVFYAVEIGLYGCIGPTCVSHWKPPPLLVVDFPR